jgi:hypothetical protein
LEKLSSFFFRFFLWRPTTGVPFATVASTCTHLNVRQPDL